MFFFFFCKQKTAYEMRISDWSSDVCSSDLHGKGSRLCRREDAGVDAAEDDDRDHEGIPDDPDRPQPEIGRASCRERVYSVRVDLGGRRIIKKKTKHLTRVQ